MNFNSNLTSPVYWDEWEKEEKTVKDCSLCGTKQEKQEPTPKPKSYVYENNCTWSLAWGFIIAFCSFFFLYMLIKSGESNN